MFHQFKQQLRDRSLSCEQIFQKHFIDADTYYFENINKNTDIEYEFKNDLSKNMNIHMNDIYIVGSGKTGYSIKPNALGRDFDGKFKTTKLRRDKSDLDVAIVSSDLFDDVQELVYDWTNGFRKEWDRNIYYDSGSSKFGVSLKYKFLEYLGKGWYRPDLAPKDFYVETENGNMKDVLVEWRRTMGINISFALYKNWNFFKKYQVENLVNVQRKIISGEIV